MYGKIFASLFHGSMRGQSDLQLVFINMIATCDEEGIVDKIPRAIADETGLPMERVNAAILELESPDAMSRSPGNEGRRIERVSDERSWGWRILNYSHYREIGNKTQRREYNRKYMREYRKPDGTPEPVGQAEAEIIYLAYPRKVGKPAAISKIMAALKTESPTHLLERTKLYAAVVAGSDQQFIPHPSTWFHQQRYNDDPKTWERGDNGRPVVRDTRKVTLS